MVRPITDQDIGLKIVHDGTEGTDPAATDNIDVVAIHGMGEHPDDTWCKRVETGNHGTYVNWLKDEAMLPAVVPKARIMRYGYHSQWFGAGAIKTRCAEISQRLLLALHRKREGFPWRPLILIAHGFGGLVVLKMLVDAHTELERWLGIYDSTIGLVFFGTPFRGTNNTLSQGEILRIAEERFQTSYVHGENLRIFRAGDESLSDLVDIYHRISRQSRAPEIACFYEQRVTNVGAILGREPEKVIQNVILVDETSGCLDLTSTRNKYSLPRDHFQMNKFGSVDEEDFETLCSVIQSMHIKGPEVISARMQCMWRWLAAKHVANSFEARKSVRKYYCVPHIAVSRFFGRQGLIADLQTFLLKPRGQDDKPNVAVLQALGGRGKSQIALELCRRLRKDCRGIFWLDATSKATIERNFEGIAEELNRPPIRLLEDTDSKVKFVLDTIQEWEERWLMVYDNYDRPDVFPDIKAFIPKSGQGAIIFTSRHEGTKVLGRHIRIPSMINDGGVELLLRDMSAEEIESSRADGEEIVW